MSGGELGIQRLGRTNVQRMQHPNKTTEKFEHIFGQSRHNLTPVVQEQGSREAAFEAIPRTTLPKADAGQIRDVFETTVTIGSYDVVVRGRAPANGLG